METKCHEMGRTPSPREPSLSKAPVERSSELLFSQVGQASATRALTVLPFLVFVMRTKRPQSFDLRLVSP